MHGAPRCVFTSFFFGFSLLCSVLLCASQAGGGSGYFFIIVLLMLAGQAISIAADKYLAGWSDRSPADQADHTQAYIYLGLVLGTVVLAVVRARSFFIFILRAASALHGRMFKSVVYSPLRFFESNPSGRILNRFAKESVRHKHMRMRMHLRSTCSRNRNPRSKF
jgi:ABC-type multidrug transport system fused ATPase/permease subunit